MHKYIEIEAFGNYVLRIMNNKKTFNNLFKCNNINYKYIYVLYNIIENVMNNLSNNINETNDLGIQRDNLIQIFNQILAHIDNLYPNNFNFGTQEIYLFGKMIKSVLKNLNKRINVSTNNEEENNNSNFNNKINSIIEQIYSVILPKYITNYYKIIFSIFENRDKKLNIDYSLESHTHDRKGKVINKYK